MVTRTGSFPIGFRRGWSDWQKDLPALTTWAKSSGFDVIDLGVASPQDLDIVKSAGLRLGTADVKDFGGLMAADPGRRREVVESTVAYVREAASHGVKVFFTCVIPETRRASGAKTMRLRSSRSAPSSRPPRRPAR